SFVPYLAQWVDLDWVLGDTTDGATADFAPGVGRLRNLVALSSRLSGRRGTAAALRRFLETATGVGGFVVEDGREDDPPFHVRVQAPAAAQPWRAIIERIIEWERPVHATVTLQFEGEAPPPAAPDGPTGPGGPEPPSD